jgi:iron complex transport system substrate-binding protein
MRRVRNLHRAALVLCALVAVGAATAATDTASTRAVTDDSGHSLRVPAPPLRIVSLAPGATETLFAAGAGSQLVATVEYSDEPPAARGIARIGDVGAVDLERLVALHPDVVVAWPGGGNPAQREKVLRLGIPVYDQQVRRLSDIPTSVRRLGVLAGTEDAAARAAQALDTQLAALKASPNAAAHPSVLLQVWNRPIYTVGGRQLMTDALATCGARNVFADLPEASPVVDREAVIARDPDIIIAAAPPGEGAAWLADWRRLPGLKAVRSGRLALFEDQALSRLGPSVIAATAALCGVLAPLSRGSY